MLNAYQQSFVVLINHHTKSLQSGYSKVGAEMNLLHYVGMVEMFNFTQQRHLTDHESRNSTLWISEDVHLLHRYESLLIMNLSRFVHFSISAFTYFSYYFIAPFISGDIHDSLNSGAIGCNRKMSVMLSQQI